MFLTRSLRGPWAIAAGGLALALYFGWLAWFLTVRLAPDPVAEAEDGAPRLKLNQQGAVLHAEHGRPLADAEVTPLLRQRMPAPGQPLIVSAPAALPYRRVYQVLRLCRAAGVESLELRVDEAAGVVVNLASAKKASAGNIDDIPSDEDLMLPNWLFIQVQSNEAGAIAKLLVRGIDVDVLLPGPADLTRYLRQLVEAIPPRDVVDISADGRLTHAALVEVLRHCREAGYEKLQLATPRRSP